MTNKPSLGVLISMALRNDHAFLAPVIKDSMFQTDQFNPDKKINVIHNMIQLWEEATGNGFWSEDNNDYYELSFKNLMNSGDVSEEQKERLQNLFETYAKTVKY